MNIAEEYRLSEYQDLGELNENVKVHLVRNKLNGMICVRKILDSELFDIYVFLKYHQTVYTPHIYEIVQNGAELIVIEEYFAGRNLEDILSEYEFTEIEAVKIIIDLCECLKLFHNANPPIICRDLKPQNVILTNENQVKLIDFDIARIYQPGKNHDTVMMGTEGYAAPEQFGFGQTDARTDIYGLGALLNYLLIQCFPTEQIANGRYRDIIRNCTQISPEDRYQNVNEVKQDLELISGLQNTNENQDVKETDNLQFGYKIPGFRTGVGWKKVLAVFGYTIITLFCFSLEFTDKNGVALDNITQKLNQVMIWISQIAYIFFVSDYRGVQNKIPNLKKNNIIRVLGCIAAYFIFVFAAAFACALVESFLR